MIPVELAALGIVLGIVAGLFIGVGFVMQATPRDEPTSTTSGKAKWR